MVPRVFEKKVPIRPRDKIGTSATLAMKVLPILLFACLTGLAQTPPSPPAPAFPNMPDETVLAVFDDGYAMTVGEFKHIFAILPQENQETALKQPEDFLKGWAVMRKLTQLARKDKLDQATPTKEKIEYYTMRILTDAEMLDASMHVNVPDAEAKQFYEAHREQFKEVSLKAIYLQFADAAASSSASSSPSSNKRTEEQTKALADKLVAELHGGADFVKLVNEYTDDMTSKAKNGDFAVIHGSDNIPEQVKTVVMSMKQGDISEPLRQPTAYYIFRAESVTYKPFDQVSDQIFTQLKSDHYRQWMEQINKDVKVDFKTPAFFANHDKPSAH